MNEKLKEKCIEYISTNFTIDETMMEDVPLSDRQYVFWLDDVSKLAEHFYNLAIANVKETILEWYNTRTTPHCVAEGDIVAPMREGYKRVIDFVDNLTK